MISKNILSRGRKHFRCEEGDGLPLEYLGNINYINPHWERDVFANELMNGLFSPHQRVSEFTLAWLEDSGWYKPNYRMAQPYRYGEGEGCDVMDGNCQASRDSCEV